MIAPADAQGQVDCGAALRMLGEIGLTRLFVEGGGRLAAGLLAHGHVDRLIWMGAPMAIGADGLPAIGPLALNRLADAPKFTVEARYGAGPDMVTELRRV